MDLSRLPAWLRPPYAAYDQDIADGFNLTALVEGSATVEQRQPVAAELRRLRRAAARNARLLAGLVTLLEFALGLTVALLWVLVTGWIS